MDENEHQKILESLSKLEKYLINSNQSLQILMLTLQNDPLDIILKSLLNNLWSIDKVSALNEILKDELAIDDFIPEEIIVEMVLAFVEQSQQNAQSNETIKIDIIENKKNDAANQRKKDKASKILKANFTSARERIHSDRSKAKSLSKRLEEFESTLPPKSFHDGKDAVIEMLFNELHLMRSKIEEMNQGINEIKGEVFREKINEILYPSKKIWNATLKEAAGIIRNNYNQDQLLAPDKRKYKYLLDASNEFFNTHEFPDDPSLSAEKLYENVKKY